MSGNWPEANEALDGALKYLPNDQPSKVIKKNIQDLGGRPPEDWSRAMKLLPTYEDI